MMATGNKVIVSLLIYLVLVSTTGLTNFAKANQKNMTITGIEGIQVGHYTENTRGCTVILFPKQGATASVAVLGSAPGTRETDLLDPINLVQKINAIVLSGGSAYGLDAASGVMAYLEKKKTGYDVGNGIVVPIVPAAVLFDLYVGNSAVRPTLQWGIEACKNADTKSISQGNIGAGAGCTVGKTLGMKQAMKSGIGSSLIELPGGVLVGALIAVNAVGDVVDPDTGQIYAGARGHQQGTFLSSENALLKRVPQNVLPGTNTTIGVVATNLALSKNELKKIAQMAHDGMARTINPVHTMYDGDTIFSVSVPNFRLPQKKVTSDDINVIGTAAAYATKMAILNAVKNARSIPGYPSAQDWKLK